MDNEVKLLDSYTGRIMKFTRLTAWEISRLLRFSGLNIVELHDCLLLHNKQNSGIDDLKTALESVLFLIEEFVPSECFENGNTGDQGIDEGNVYAMKLINQATRTLFQHMSLAEKQNSPLFHNQKET